MACNAHYLHFQVGRDALRAQDTLAELAQLLNDSDIVPVEILEPNGFRLSYNLESGPATLSLLPISTRSHRTIELFLAPNAPVPSALHEYGFTRTSDPYDYFAARFREDTDRLEKAFRDAAANAFRLPPG